MKNYRHYKNGHLYKVLHVATHTETNEEMVVYQRQYAPEELGENPIFVRPKDMFFEEVEYKGVKVPRFKELNNGLT
jgi:hypothetical protein